MQLCNSPEKSDEKEPRDIINSLPNPNGLVTDMTYYIKGVTKLFVNQNGVARPAFFDLFSESDGQYLIYVIKEGETKPGFYRFPQSKYVFPSKDDAQSYSDKETCQFGNSPSRMIVSAFGTKPEALVPSLIQSDEDMHERSYHAQVDEQLQIEVVVPQREKVDAQQEIKNANVLQCKTVSLQRHV